MKSSYPSYKQMKQELDYDTLYKWIQTEPHTIQSTDSSGYKHVIGYNTNYREHRYIMEQILGRKLSKEEHVHHIDFNKENNNPNNLFLFESNHKHHLYHGYIMKFPYISPQEFIDKYNDKINWLYSYDTLYDLYINKKLSCNKISKMYPEISTRAPITNALKKFGIYYLRQPSVNQFD